MEKCISNAGKLRNNREELDTGEHGRRCCKARCLACELEIRSERPPCLIVGAAGEFEFW
jgi:hypothetical protein